jgi:multidrug resistance efflux pump
MVERDALGSGVYVGDSYNDEPRSAQRLDEIAQTIGSVRADLARQEARVTRAEAALKRERDAYTLVRSADLTAPVGGRVWEVLTAPGEQVAAGQALFSVLNCAQPLVTAAVSEAVYNSLSVGMPARFIFREGGDPMPGHVVQLSGVASASSNFAIVPSALTKESYRVAVALDGAPDATGCAVGRTGRVVFGATGQ